MNHLKSLLFTVLLLTFTSGFAGQVNVNTASAEQLATELTGIGESKAQAIVTYRSEHGDFKSADDLAMVKGIGQKTVEANRENILLSE